MEKELPRLHGWITPEYALQMIREMLDYLHKNSPDDFEYIRKYTQFYEVANASI